MSVGLVGKVRLTVPRCGIAVLR